MTISAPINNSIDVRLPNTPELVDDPKVFNELLMVYQAIKNLQAAAASNATTAATSINQILHVREEQPASTNGGSSVVGNQVRILNTVVSNTIPGASLAGNQITLPLGKYQINASAPTYTANQHRIRLINITDAVVVLLGSSEYAVAATTDRSLLIGVFNITATKSFNITHFTSVAIANGLGVNSADTFIEVFTNVIITKIG